MLKLIFRYSLHSSIAGALCIFFAAEIAGDTSQKNPLPSEQKAASSTVQPGVPSDIPEADADGTIYLTDGQGRRRATTLKPDLQSHLTKALQEFRSPIAGVVVADVKTGSILALAQGKNPDQWGGKTHTALHAGFPAASLFKTVVTTAALEMANIDETEPFVLHGGCAHVRPTGVWLRDKDDGAVSRMSLRRAFGASCNDFYAKIAVNNLGLGIITDFARKFGWDTGVPTDFHLDKSPWKIPSARNSSTYTVGRFAAGFGYVGINTIHAAWMMMLVAHDGLPMPMRIFRDTPVPAEQTLGPALFSKKTSRRLKGILDASVQGGTASFAFRRGKYQKVRPFVGGKTGTLTGNSPRGLTTWFTGLAPLENPEIVVSAVVMLEDRWFVKGPQLAAEAFWAYYHLKDKPESITTATTAPPSNLR